MDAQPEVVVIAGALGGARPSLYGVFDAARDPHVLRDLDRIGVERHCLFEGQRAQTLEPYAPYLVALNDAGRLDALLTTSWGKARGIYLSSSAPLRELRRRLLSLLEVTTEEERKLHFRFYDPRVARVFLASLTPRQAASVFDEVQRYWIEGEDPNTLVRFERTESKVVESRVDLSAVRQ